MLGLADWWFWAGLWHLLWFAIIVRGGREAFTKIKNPRLSFWVTFILAGVLGCGIVLIILFEIVRRIIAACR
jgi:hypothetical protein